MSRSIFGWSLPPGVTNRDIENAMGGDGACEVCGYGADDCRCPECPTCRVVGDPNCYDGHLISAYFAKLNHRAHPSHGLIRNKEQLVGIAKREVIEAEGRLADAKQYLAWLESREENITEKDVD